MMGISNGLGITNVRDVVTVEGEVQVIKIDDGVTVVKVDV